jgi:tRNA(fMet)-specific endonuclease VapC
MRVSLRYTATLPWQRRTVLRRKGTPMGAYDLLIAAHALSLGLILVTNNLREFCRVPQLIMENWVEEER